MLVKGVPGASGVVQTSAVLGKYCRPLLMFIGLQDNEFHRGH